jgi:hypothetical protein
MATTSKIENSDKAVTASPSGVFSLKAKSLISGSLEFGSLT